MQWQLSLSVMAEAGTALGILIIAVCFPWRDISRRANLIGSVLLVIAALWILTHSLEIGMPVASYKAYLMGLQLIWGLLALTLWLMYIIHYTATGKWQTSRIYILFGIMPLLAILAVATNHVYGLMWTAPGLDIHNPYLPLKPAYGLFYWASMAYMGALIASGSYLILKKVFRQHNFRRWEPWILILAVVIPILVAFLEVTGFMIPADLAVGITPFFSGIGSIALVWSLPRFHLQKVIPVARDTVFEHIGDGVVVLNMQNRVIDLNPAAERLAGYTSSQALGLPVEQIWTNWPSQLVLSEQASTLLEDLVLAQAGEQRTYNLHTYTITDHKNRPLNKVALLIDTTERKHTQKNLKQNLEKLSNAMEQTIQAMSNISEVRDPYTAGHQRRVAQLSTKIAMEMGLPKTQIDGIRMAALIHDIGKVGIPAELLSKPGKLTIPELDMIRTHPQVGYEILEAVDFPWPIAQIILQHHERMDGSGYPAKLSGEHILPEARIIAVADVVEAISSHRPYRPAFGIDSALKEIIQQRGKLYDSNVVQACENLIMHKGFKFSIT